MENFWLVLCALLPAVVLGIYIFLKDRVEKEPIRLIAALMISGIVICFPVIKVGGVIDDIIIDVFCHFGSVNSEGVLELSSFTYRCYNAAKYFISVAFVEEGFKWLAMFAITRDNKNFNSLFDGIVYAAFVSLGFAAYENILYALNYGWDTVIIRAFTAVPGHVFNSIFMGYYYSLWHVYRKARMQERALKQKGYIRQEAEEFKSGKFLFLSISIPVLMHGFYDYSCTIGTLAMDIVFYAFLYSLYLICFRKVQKMSRIDSIDTAFATRMVINKHKALARFLAENHSGSSAEHSIKFIRPLKLSRNATVLDIIEEMQNN